MASAMTLSIATVHNIKPANLYEIIVDLNF